MRKIIFLLFTVTCMLVNAQYIPNQRDLEIDDVMETDESSDLNLKMASSNNFYYDFNNWIPYCNSEPLKNPPYKYIDVTFHVFLDNNGENSLYTNSEEGRNELLNALSVVNRVYSGEWEPSDPVEGRVELPNRDSKIRFTLGENNERIYFYNNTTMNHHHSSSTFYNYIQSEYPSRISKLNVFFTAGYSGGYITQDNIVLSNGGSGYTTEPTVTFSSGSATATAVIENGSVTRINIQSGGFYTGFNPPQVTISGGNGNGATATVTKLNGGASGYANMPSFDLTRNNFVVMLHCHETNSWLSGLTLAHEFAHNLDLLHTYCGGGATVVCCSSPGTSGCQQGCDQNINDPEYLSDLFGPSPGTCPHLSTWEFDPYDNSISNGEKITNNLMGGSNSAVYLSPMQVGQMHRALALKSVRKYVKRETYFHPVPLKITKDEIWDFNLKLYRDINILYGGSLILSDEFILPYNGTINVENGAGLAITGKVELFDNNTIVVKSGGSLKISSSSELNVFGAGKIIVEDGGYFCIEDGANIHLDNFNSIIELQNGYNIGVSSKNTPTLGCVSNPSSYQYSGSGCICTYLDDVYIYNQTISTNQHYIGRNIYVDNVNIINNASVIFEAEQNVHFNDEIDADLGSSFEIIHR